MSVGYRLDGYPEAHLMVALLGGSGGFSMLVLFGKVSVEYELLVDSWVGVGTILVGSC